MKFSDKLKALNSDKKKSNTLIIIPYGYKGTKLNVLKDHLDLTNSLLQSSFSGGGDFRNKKLNEISKGKDEGPFIYFVGHIDQEENLKAFPISGLLKVKERLIGAIKEIEKQTF